MLSLIILISIASIIFIFLVHHLLSFFKSTLTVPKIKDLVNSPNQKYQHIYDTITHKTNINETYINNINTDESDNTNMKNELKSFLKNQMNKNNEMNNDIIGMDSMEYSYMNI
jgi:cell shape-determining protein MreC